MAARRTPPARDAIDDALVAGVAEAVRRALVLPIAKLTKEKLTPRARDELVQRLVAGGLERTPKTVRVPLAEQIHALLAGGARVALKDLARRVKGASPKAEIARTLDALRKQGRAAVVVRTVAEIVVGPGERLLTAAEVAELAKIHAALGKTLKKVAARGGPRTLLREDLAALLAPLAAPLAAPAAPPADAASVRRALLAVALAAREGPVLKLVPVPDLVRGLASALPVADVHLALHEAVEAGWLELRPEAGEEFIKPEDAALCPPGPRGTVLYFARRIAP
jgi:hypothetical protein